jgi:hypothetical protein
MRYLLKNTSFNGCVLPGSDSGGGIFNVPFISGFPNDVLRKTSSSDILS